MNKICPEGKILNPVSGRCVDINGKIGREILRREILIQEEKRHEVKHICPEGKILNPESGRCVDINGKIGKEILRRKRLAKEKKRRVDIYNHGDPTFENYNNLPKELICDIASFLPLTDFINFTKLGSAANCKKFPSIIVQVFINTYGNRALLQYIKQNEFPINDRIIKAFCKKIDPSANDNEIFIYASKNGKDKLVESLLKDPRVNPAINDNAAIRGASHNGHYKVVKLLLNDSRVDPAAKNNNSVRFAAYKKKVKVLKILLEDPRVNPAIDRNEILKYVQYHGYDNIEKILLKDPRVISEQMRL